MGATGCQCRLVTYLVRLGGREESATYKGGKKRPLLPSTLHKGVCLCLQQHPALSVCIHVGSALCSVRSPSRPVPHVLPRQIAKKACRVEQAGLVISKIWPAADSLREKIKSVWNRGRNRNRNQNRDKREVKIAKAQPRATNVFFNRLLAFEEVRKREALGVGCQEAQNILGYASTR